MARSARIAFISDNLFRQNSYSELMWQLVEREASRHGIELLLFWNEGRESGAAGLKEYLDLVKAARPDACLVSATLWISLGAELYHALLAGLAGEKVMTLLEDSPGHPAVFVDNRPGLEALIEHTLAVHGRRKVGIMHGPLAFPESRLRLELAQEILARHGVESSPELCIEGGLIESEIYRSLADLFGRTPDIDALVCFNDEQALFAVQFAESRGISVPGELSVIGYDDIPLSGISSPSLSTVNQALDEQIEAAMRHLSDWIGSDMPPPFRSVIRSRMALRESCGCAAPDDKGGRNNHPAVRRLTHYQNLMDVVNELGSRLINGMGPEQLPGLFSETMAKLGLRHWALNLSDNPQSGELSCRTVVSLPACPGGGAFRLPDFAPQAWLETLDSRKLLVLPLNIGTRWYGTLCLELCTDAGLVAATLRTALIAWLDRECRESLRLAQLVEEIARTHLETEKLSLLTRLVTGVAHEINTPLGVAITAASYLASLHEQNRPAPFQAGDPTREGLQLLESNLAKVKSLVKRFKRIAVEEGSQEETRHELAEWLACTLKRLEFPGCRIELDCPAGLVLTLPFGAIQEILQQLAANAQQHAWPDGAPGTISLACRMLAPPERLELVFSDDGCGIPESRRNHIFEPFAGPHLGRLEHGLGLPVVWNLVTLRLKGTIRLETAAGRGTKFSISLPLPR